MKIGIASSVYVLYPMDETIRRVAAAGFDCIDVWSGRPHIYRRDFDRNDLQKFRRLAADCGLQISSFMPAFHRYPYNLSSPHDVARQDSLEYMRDALDNAAVLGAPTVLVVPGYTLHGQGVEDGWARLRDSIATICGWAKPRGIKVGIEAVNHSDLIRTAADARRMIGEVGEDLLGIVLDSGHIHLVDETAAEAIRLAGDRLFQMHVNDNDGSQQQNLVPGEGTFDFELLMAALREIRYDGVISAELGYQYATAPDVAAARTAEWLRAAIHSGPMAA